MHHPRHVPVRALVLLVGAVLLAGATRPQAQEPRFRGGANLVRLDVYASVDGVALTDLTADDFEVSEDNAPQTVSSFEFVQARGPAPAAARVESNTVGEMRERAAQPDARAFVLFLDRPHVQVSGSYHAASPVAAMLERVVGADDLVGVMTPDMSARNMTFSPRTASVGDMLRASWAWGERGRRSETDPREDELRDCFADRSVEALILKRREQKTLDALADLLDHLEATRDQRTFVFVLTEGWRLSRPDEALTAPQSGVGSAGVGATPGTPGRPDALGRRDATVPGTATPSCERERSLVALADHASEFRLLVQRANRANVSFYPIDARGLVAFDNVTPAASPRNPSLTADAAGLSARQDSLRMLAEETDGAAVLNTAPDAALPRLMTDIGSYYLLGYVSTNTKLDGRYRRLTVRVKRPGVTVRARPGYLAPSASDMAAAQAPSTTGAGRASSPSASVTDALSRLPVSRRPLAIHLAASGAPGRVAVTVELDRVTAALPDWANGGRLAVAVEPADRGTGARAHVTSMLTAGSRVGTVRLPEGDGGPLTPGRYQVRVEALAEGARTPVVVSTIVDVPAGTALLGSALLATRRGPGTGRVFEPTADPRFRRTERLQAEVARIDAAAVVTGRLLNRAGQVMQVPVAISERPATDTLPATVVAEIALAPLAAGEYVLELIATSGERSESRTYPIRMVP